MLTNRIHAHDRAQAQGQARDDDRHHEHVVQPYADDLSYIEDELRWLYARLSAIAATRPVRSRDEHDRASTFGGVELHPADAVELDVDVRASRGQRRSRREADRLRTHIDARRDATRAAGRSLSFDAMCAAHGLSDFERLVLLLAAAPTFSSGFKTLFHRIRMSTMLDDPTVEIAFELADLGLAERLAHRRCFADAAPLSRGGLLSIDVFSRDWTPAALLDVELTLTTAALSEMLGEPSLDAEFESFSSLEAPRATFDRVVLPDADRERIVAVVDRHDELQQARAAWGIDDVITYGRASVLLFHGAPGTGKTLTAHAVADHLGARVLNVDIPTFVRSREADRFLPGLFRQAQLRGALLFFDECEALFSRRELGNDLMTLLLTELERFEGVVILATNMPERLDAALMRRALVRVGFRRPDVAARARIWSGLLPDKTPLADDVDVDALARRFDLTGGYIKNAVLTAVAAAVRESGTAGPLRQAHLEQAAAAQLVDLAPTDASARVPAVRLGDVVLPPTLADEVSELIDAARHTSTVFDRWQVAGPTTRGRGLVGLLAGPPGTGKSITAEAIAGELGRPLMRCNVAALRSKWVGETGRQLTEFFRDAQAQRAVLLLDEVDSLLRARGEGAASRHDDADVNLLLGLLEGHDGVVLMATNLPQALDAALGRRVTWRLDFAAPTATARAEIWRRMLGDRVPTAGRVSFRSLGERFALSGGEIHAAVLRAAFRAAAEDRALSQADLEQAAAERLVTAGATSAGFDGAAAVQG